MFCPGCGSKNSIEQKFCRACGMNLEQTAALMIENMPAARRDLELREKRLEKFGAVAFSGLGIVIGIGVLAMLYAILTTMVLSGTQPLAGLLIMAFIFFAGLSLGYVFWNEDLKEKRKKLERGAAGAPEIGPAHTRELPEPSVDFVPSVVEDTTRSLDRRR